jgi:hypothetical protein
VSGRQNARRILETFAMAKADPTSPKRISLGWLVCGGMALGVLLVPFAVYVTVGIYDAFYGSCALKTASVARCGNSSSRRPPLFPVAWSDLSLPIGSVAGGTRRISDQ